MADTIISTLSQYLPLALALTLVTGSLFFLHYLLLGRHSHLNGEQKLPRQVTLLVLTIAGLVLIAVSLPVSESTRNQIIALIGVLTSGVIAFSSTTMVSNLVAGLVLKVNRPFRIGDFIRVSGHSGRVAEMGLLDTEIQTETRELIAFSNSHMINNPVSVVRASGAIISVDLSLGYDVHHSEVETHLLSAAQQSELKEPFVQVIALGDFAVTYRVAGLLMEVKSLISARSRLHKSVLDCLHNANIEIVSPGFINQRPQVEGVRMIPARSSFAKEAKADSSPEALVFDKAEQAEKKEKSRTQLEQEIAEIESQLENSDGDTKQQLVAQRDRLTARLTRLIAQNDKQE